ARDPARSQPLTDVGAWPRPTPPRKPKGPPTTRQALQLGDAPPPATAARRQRRPAVRAAHAAEGPAGRLDAGPRNRPDRRPQHRPAPAVSRPGGSLRRARARPRPAAQARLPAHVRPRFRPPARLSTDPPTDPTETRELSEPLQNDRFLRALRREPVDRTPVWLMRQAGRYLPEYRATRARAGSFMGLATNPELACEVTLQPLRRFDLDAAILFSDILTIPDAMGLGLYFVDGEGPKFERPVRDAAAIARLGVPDMETELRYVMDAIRVIHRELAGKVPLIGFSGSPWT